MSTPITDTADAEETRPSDETDRHTSPSRFRSAVGSGAAAALAGGLLLAAAARTAAGNRRRAGLLALVGSALVAVGLRQRRSADDAATETDEVSTEARANLERADVMHQAETNPRGVSEEPDVETRTDSDEGDVQFTTGQGEDVANKPELDGTEEDPRQSDEDDAVPDDHVEIDLSEAAMADEASEATGPEDEQAYPAFEGTDPEPTSEKSPERTGEGAVANKGPDGEDETDEDTP